ncbi:MAG: hypothetical protein GY851_02485 [bacterium]|nr:hypothetical protein [bacterium]
MAKIGLWMAIAGVVGGILAFVGVLQLSGMFTELHTWFVITIIGIVLYFMTRRPND